jgi:uncharacterized protein (TIGR03435 family)
MNAYISYFQFSGPQWMNDLRFEVIATLPADTTKEQFRIMVQNLLAERFKLAVHRHHEPKFQESAAAERVTAGAEVGKQVAPGPVTQDKDGYPVLAFGTREAMISGPKGVMYARVRASGDDAMAFLVSQLSGQLAAPVEDDAGLTGKYDFTLSWISHSPNSPNLDTDEDGPSLFTAVRDQLGLKLTAKKGEVEIIVVDRAEKQTAEN